MIAATMDRPTTATASGVVVCPHCGRFMTERRILTPLPAGCVFSRVVCKRCNRWRWIDLATGCVVHTPPEPAP